MNTICIVCSVFCLVCVALDFRLAGQIFKDARAIERAAEELKKLLRNTEDDLR